MQVETKKTAEIQRMAREGIQLVCLKDIPEAADVPQAEENGITFKENATIKAKYWADKLNMPVLAEDSGIEIDTLSGCLHQALHREVTSWCECQCRQARRTQS